MNGNSGRRRWARAAGAAAAFVWLGAAGPIARLDVSLDGLRSTQGLVRLCVTADPASFPKCHGDPRAAKVNVPATVRAVSVEGLPPGAYAMAVMHDENGNKRLDTFAGIPREGFGFSRNPVVRFGPPGFEAARFAVAGPSDRQAVRIRYML